MWVLSWYIHGDILLRSYAVVSLVQDLNRGSDDALPSTADADIDSKSPEFLLGFSGEGEGSTSNRTSNVGTSVLSSVQAEFRVSSPHWCLSCSSLMQLTHCNASSHKTLGQNSCTPFIYQNLMVLIESQSGCQTGTLKIYGVVPSNLIVLTSSLRVCTATVI